MSTIPATVPAPGPFSPSGGLVWHLRACRSRRRWAPFVEALDRWFRHWDPGTDGLLLLGPSAGWCLPPDLPCRFRHVVAVDLDTLAPRLFRARHGRRLARSGTSLEWVRADALGTLEALLTAWPDHAVLFANLLGQHRFHLEAALTDRRPGSGAAGDEDASVDAALGLATHTLGTLATRLRGRPWASFHDRLSGRIGPHDVVPAAFDHVGRIDANRLAARVARGGEWLDHLTGDVLPPDAPRRLLPWSIRPGWLHWIEVGAGDP